MSFLPSRSFQSGGGKRSQGITFEAKEVILFREKYIFLGGQRWGSLELRGTGDGFRALQGETSWASVPFLGSHLPPEQGSQP